MKRKNIQNTNGIAVCDSIVMSVKNKRPNMRKPFSVAIALIGYASVILSFLGMFDLKFDHGKIFLTSCVIAAFYIVLTVIEGKALWLFVASLFAYIFAAYKNVSKIVLGFQYVYNIIYSKSFHTAILYYKGLKPSQEVSCVTTMMLFYIWMLAIVIFFFTICRPNPILPLLVSFPVIEIGLYNGIELPVIRGMFVIAYWLALLGMCTIDIGEYSGGQSGFVRKNNLFFPKRHMKLKVTEKCGAVIMASVIVCTLLSCAFLRIVNYKRSDEINQKRNALSEAANNFNMDNVAESFADLMTAAGFDVQYENNKLGTNDHVTYKNVTDLQIAVSAKPNCALYIKKNTGSDYHDNEWFNLPDGSYDDPDYSDCVKYGINPQDFPSVFAELVSNTPEHVIWIKSLLKSKKSYYPYALKNTGNVSYEYDTSIISKDVDSKEMTYTFYPFTVDELVDQLSHKYYANDPNLFVFGALFRGTYSTDLIEDPTVRELIRDYCNTHESVHSDGSGYFAFDHEIFAPDDYLYQNGQVLLAEVLENNYKNFVYKNYLRVPDTEAMHEVHEYYSDVVDNVNILNAKDELTVLQNIRDRMAAESEYSLRPGKTPSNRDFVNYFLLENHKGYCMHYATSGVILARMAGIPARYATGYVVVGDDFNNDTKQDDNTFRIDVKDNRSHSWAEVYINGIGWMPFEFTAGYSNSSIQPEAPDPSKTTTTDVTKTTDGSKTKSTGDSSNKSHGTNAGTTYTTAAQTTTAAGIGIPGFEGGNGTGSGKLTGIIKMIVFLAACAGFLLLRRSLILKMRAKRFTTGKNDDRMSNIYSYAEKLISELDINSENGKFTEYAEEVEKRLSGRYFKSGDFKKMTQTALRTWFGNTTPTPEELEFSRSIVESIASRVYTEKNILGKLCMKFIDALI